jgi:hypothetical protein
MVKSKKFSLLSVSLSNLNFISGCRLLNFCQQIINIDASIIINYENIIYVCMVHDIIVFS